MRYLEAGTKHLVRLTLNGRAVEGCAEPRLLLTDFLRQELGMSGTHVGCEHGVCGACTVRIDGKVMRGCLTYAVQADGRSIETIEGLAGADGGLSDLQSAFRKHHALQCGFCTPGILTTLVPFLKENPNPSDEEIREAISGNLCRCTGYQHIIDSVRLAAEKMAQI